LALVQPAIEVWFFYSRIPKDQLHGNERSGLHFRSGSFFPTPAEVFCATACIPQQGEPSKEKKDALWAEIAKKIKNSKRMIHSALLVRGQ